MLKSQVDTGKNEEFSTKVKLLKKRLEDIRSAEKVTKDEFGLEDDFDVSARLFIVIKNGFEIEEVSNLLSVKPDFAWKEGAKFEMWGQTHNRPDTVWGLESVSTKCSLEEHLDNILSKLDSSKSNMSHFLEDDGFDVYIRLAIDMRAGLGGFMVLSATLERLKNICNYVMFSHSWE